MREGKLIDKTLVYALLHNRTYLGELRHKDQWYPAEHLPIVEQEWCDKAPVDQQPCPWQQHPLEGAIPA